MLDFLREGGVAVWLILALGGGSLVSAIGFIARPAARKRATFYALTGATLLASACGTLAGFGMTFRYVQRVPATENVGLIVMTGLAESLVNAIVGLTLLTIAWMIYAAGERRLRPQLS